MIVNCDCNVNKKPPSEDEGLIYFKIRLSTEDISDTELSCPHIKY